jgi:diguanylate cyclase (GGDEF)-like protein/PAS domain S-box-containing protein
MGGIRLPVFRSDGEPRPGARRSEERERSVRRARRGPLDNRPAFSAQGQVQESQALGLTAELRNALLENLSDGVYFVDRQRRILYWNRGAEQITGFGAEEVLGRRCNDGILKHCDESGTILCGENCPLLAAIHDGQQREVHVYLHHKDGHRKPVRVSATPIHDSEGRVIGAVETFHDDGALARTRQRAAYLLDASMRDPLTGVGNRRLGETVLAGLLEQYHRFQFPFGVLVADVDHFKLVNDRYGHNVGDEALKVIARTFADNARQGDQVIRWGGEEFVILIASADAATLAATAERFRMLVTRTRLLADRRHVPLSISLGGTIVAPGDSAELIIRRADALLYESKSGGRNRATLDVDLEVP